MRKLHGGKAAGAFLEDTREDTERLRKLVTIENMQCRFSKGKGTTDAIFAIKFLQERFLQVQRKLYFTFVDLEKGLIQIPEGIGILVYT